MILGVVLLIANLLNILLYYLIYAQPKIMKKWRNYALKCKNIINPIMEKELKNLDAD